MGLQRVDKKYLKCKSSEKEKRQYANLKEEIKIIPEVENS